MHVIISWINIMMCMELVDNKKVLVLDRKVLSEILLKIWYYLVVIHCINLVENFSFKFLAESQTSVNFDPSLKKLIVRLVPHYCRSLWANAKEAGTHHPEQSAIAIGSSTLRNTSCRSWLSLRKARPNVPDEDRRQRTQQGESVV